MSTSLDAFPRRTLLLLLLCAGCGTAWCEEAPIAPVPAVDVGKPTFFERHQEADGHWSVSAFAAHCTSEPGCGAAAASNDADVAVTGQIMLVHEDAGYDHIVPSRHRLMLKRAVDWLVSRQKIDGSFSDALEADCWASAALGQAYSMSGDAQLKPSVARAMTSLLERRVRDQDGNPCGWGDQDSGWIDARLTAWAMLAIRSGVASELVDVAEARRSLGWIEAALSVVDKPGDFPARFNIRSRAHEGGGGAPFAAFASVLSGTTRDLIRDSLLKVAAAMDPAADTDLAGIFATTEALFIARSADRSTWADAFDRFSLLRRRLEREQVHGHGCSEGTWDPAAWPGTRGRLESTALAALTLGIFSWHDFHVNSH